MMMFDSAVIPDKFVYNSEGEKMEMKEKLFAEAKEAILRGDLKKAQEVARTAMGEKIDPVEILRAGFIPGISSVGDLFGTGKLFLPDLILSAEAMKAATEICNEYLPAERLTKKGRLSSERSKAIFMT